MIFYFKNSDNLGSIIRIPACFIYMGYARLILIFIKELKLDRRVMIYLLS
ncbi:protein of unknown function [Candidatus Nitrosocosmicus franklandus]|uniref:Uncharacterized protein n=1 Tax=Candidatus Nitrosocosmicus franklandianus TaxID=1798806 RepID=A0A484I7H7_9ARCH|nr:protein of unknown function [Candidatus Nitrosocosmicus franklandus]